jgi:acetyltransferase-like isoleucine patch superfamily enzyme
MNDSPKEKIATDAIVRNCNFESNSVVIGKGARVEGVYAKGKKIEINDGSVLMNCKLISNGSVIIGKNVIIKENAVINSFKSIYVGDRTIIDREVMIGGMQSQKSEIKVGSDCVILFRSYLNNTRKITLGNNVGIGGYCLIFTHSAWQNVLEGNPYKFANVIIENDVWLPWNITVLPGVIIHKNATIGSGSVVTKNIPPDVFAAGVPAKIIKKKNSQKLSKIEKNQLMVEILNDFCGYLLDFLKKEIKSSKTDKYFKISLGEEHLVFTTDFSKVGSKSIIISFTIPNKLKQKNSWIELDTETSKINSDLANDFVVFVRRYGIKITD